LPVATPQSALARPLRLPRTLSRAQARWGLDARLKEHNLDTATWRLSDLAVDPVVAPRPGVVVRPFERFTPEAVRSILDNGGNVTTALPGESTPDTAACPGAAPVSVALYVDADNQSPQCAGAVLGVLRADFGMRVVKATVAGNNHGQQTDRWREALLSLMPDLVVETLAAPHRKQGADIALLMALGAGLERHIREREVVVVVSRDDLLIGAAEQARARGCRTLIAYADSDLSTARNPHLTTLLLPTLAKPPSLSATSPVVVPPPVAAPSRPPAESPEHKAAAVLATLRGTCSQQPGGGYAATDVGQALSKLGYDKAARRRFLASVPGLKKSGSGPTLTLVF
jgi:hypothetical protein